VPNVQVIENENLISPFQIPNFISDFVSYVVAIHTQVGFAEIPSYIEGCPDDWRFFVFLWGFVSFFLGKTLLTWSALTLSPSWSCPD
jgi:hypothetical protein